jgi:hypothetical protein
MSSEDLYKIPPQPDPICPLLDGIQDNLYSLKHYGKSAPQPQSTFIDDEVTSTLLELETIREEIIRLREWGQGWKDLALSETCEQCQGTGRVTLTEYQCNHESIETLPPSLCDPCGGTGRVDRNPPKGA